MKESEKTTIKAKTTSLLSDIILLITNIIPLLGVIFFEWEILIVLILYWSESGIIGIYNLIKMCKVGGEKLVPKMLFFMFHYGGFILGHYFFLLIGGIFIGLVRPSMIDKGLFAPLWENETVLIAIIILFFSHGISFFKNFIGHKEYERLTLSELMGKPYSRILLMQFIILGSAFIMVLIQSEVTLIPIIIMVITKTVIDFIAHKRGHKL